MSVNIKDAEEKKLVIGYIKNIHRKKKNLLLIKRFITHGLIFGVLILGLVTTGDALLCTPNNLFYQKISTGTELIHQNTIKSILRLLTQ